MLKPLLYEKFAGAPIIIVVDPAGTQRAQTDERSAVDIIKAEGFRVMPARTNNITPRIAAVDDYLMRQVDGDPGFLMDPSCIRLKAALMGGYRFKKNGDGLEKSGDAGKHSHIGDAISYLMMHIGSLDSGEMLHTRREVRRVDAKGWA